MANNLSSGMISGIGSGMLGLEMPLHPQQQQQQQQQQQSTQNPQNPHHLHPHQQMVAYAHHDADHHQQPHKQGYQFVAKSKQLSPLSDEDEPGFNADDGSGDAKKKMSPWQRMKWTDSMVRLLIMAVYYIGDEAGSEGNDPPGKKKAGGLLQKKGKWKSVSRAMMEKGFYVSPQQCEDKFNDLNKRYKRVNDILGKGTACRVVENQSLLETMDLSPKMKEEVRKLLNSKHLFFREMCAYHNGCGHGAAGTSGANHSPEVAAEPSQIQHHQAQQERCLHSSDNAQVTFNSSRVEKDGPKLVKVHSEEDEEDDVDDDSDEDDDDEEETIDGHPKGHSGHGRDEDDENDEKSSRKRLRKELYPSLSPLVQQFSGELITLMQDGSKSDWEKKQWMKVRLMQLEEQQVSCRYQTFELERQKLKWIKFSTKKEREMERAKLENERRRLEIERMVLLVRQKELEVLEHQNHNQPQQVSSSKRGDPSSVTV